MAYCPSGVAQDSQEQVALELASKKIKSSHSSIPPQPRRPKLLPQYETEFYSGCVQLTKTHLTKSLLKVSKLYIL